MTGISPSKLHQISLPIGEKSSAAETANKIPQGQQITYKPVVTPAYWGYRSAAGRLSKTASR